MTQIPRMGQMATTVNIRPSQVREFHPGEKEEEEEEEEEEEFISPYS